MRLQTYTHERHAHHWLVANGTDVAVSYARVGLTSDRRFDALVEVETRSEFQNNGYATLLIELIADFYSVDFVRCYGLYTLDGYHFVRHLVVENGKPEGILDPMSFVYDWSALLPKVC